MSEADGAFGEPRRLGHLIQRRRVEAVLGEDVGGGVEQRASRLEPPLLG